MKILPGKTMDDHLASVAQRLPKEAVSKFDDVECKAIVKVGLAYMISKSWYDNESPGRPGMYMEGRCTSVQGELPYGLSELKFDKNEGIPVDLFYEFSDDELSELVGKGLYTKGFQCPDSLKTEDLVIPVYCKFNIVKPINEADLPVVFADIANRRAINIDYESSGYRFADYFETVHAEQEQEDMFDFEYEDLDASLDLFGHEDAPEMKPEPEEEATLSEEELRLQEQYGEIHKRVVEEHVNVPLEPEAVFVSEEQEAEMKEAKIVAPDVQDASDVIEDVNDDEFDDIFVDEDAEDEISVDETKADDEKVGEQREHRRVAIEDIEDAVRDERRKVSSVLEDVVAADEQASRDADMELDE